MTSPRSLRALGLVLVSTLASTLAGCWVEPDHDYEAPAPQYQDPPVPVNPSPSTPVKPASVDIAAGQTLQQDGGKGIGVYVEYTGGGRWHLWATCDTLTSNARCRFNLLGTPETGAMLTSVINDASSVDDSLGASTRDRFDVTLNTAYEQDGVTLQVDPPGSAITLQASLDGQDDANMIFWVAPTADGVGVIRSGAPSNPVTFVPDVP